MIFDRDGRARSCPRRLASAVLPHPRLSALPPPQARQLPLPKVPKVSINRKLQLSQIIKGCWQLDGRHRCAYLPCRLPIPPPGPT